MISSSCYSPKDLEFPTTILSLSWEFSNLGIHLDIPTWKSSSRGPGKSLEKSWKVPGKFLEKSWKCSKNFWKISGKFLVFSSLPEGILKLFHGNFCFFSQVFGGFLGFFVGFFSMLLVDILVFSWSFPGIFLEFSRSFPGIHSRLARLVVGPFWAWNWTGGGPSVHVIRLCSGRLQASM